MKKRKTEIDDKSKSSVNKRGRDGACAHLQRRFFRELSYRIIPRRWTKLSVERVRLLVDDDQVVKCWQTSRLSTVWREVATEIQVIPLGNWLLAAVVAAFLRPFDWHGDFKWIQRNQQAAVKRLMSAAATNVLVTPKWWAEYADVRPPKPRPTHTVKMEKFQ